MSYTYKDNSKEVLKAMEKAIKNGLTAIGQRAETHAKQVLTDTVYTGEKDYLTGRLRNSITFAISGKKANISSYSYNENGETKKANYQGTAPEDDKKSVYIGTNVVYAAGIELGTRRKAGAVHFLKRAVTEHSDEYKKLMKDAMKNA